MLGADARGWGVDRWVRARTLGAACMHSARHDTIGYIKDKILHIHHSEVSLYLGVQDREGNDDEPKG